MKQTLFYGKTDPGLVREKNEDIFLIDEKIKFCLVADGIGGSRAGEIASRMFADTVADCFKDMKDIRESNAPGFIKKVFSTANKKILDHSMENPDCSGMGCTAELILFFNNSYLLGHIGDSKTFRMRDGKLKQLTTDHSLVQEQIRQGLITENEAERHAFKNLLIRAVGIEKNPSLDILKGETLDRDRFLLCSDGLTDMIAFSDIEDTLNATSDNRAAVDKLIDNAKKNGGRDNITVVIVQIDE
ncbi:MAG: Stp1/IreP family PP2C-type Ser/Thr phosphatase [Desulfobacteraceae bacterium]